MDQGYDPAELAAHVGRVDPDRHMAAGFAPPPMRARLIALYAFNHEISRVRDRVREPLLGQIRLAWWREAVDEIYDPARTPRRHEAALALRAAFADAAPPRLWVDRLIDAHERDLDSAPLTGAAAETHARATSGALMRIGAWLLAPEATLPDRAEAAILHLGAAWGLAGMARRAAQEQAADGRAAALADRAQASHAQGRALYDSIPAGVAPAALYAALTPAWLARAQRGGEPSLLSRQARLLWASALGRL